jgi:hypothetical protein
MLLVVHDTDDEASRDALGELLLAGGEGVEVQWLDPSRAVAMIVPSDLALDPEQVE